MSLGDVFSGRQSFMSWLTGRDPAESDVYAHYDQVEKVTDELRTIATTSVGNAQDSIYTALNQLNSVNGVAEYVGTVTVSNYDSVFESISDTISGIADQMEGKAEDIKTYEEAPWYGKVASTATMAVFKAGEGLLSCVEDLGDGIVSIVGWGAGVLGNEQFQNDCANFVKKEWSHDAFNFYYNSDFAKMSAITEDSAIAGGLKIAGKAVGYIYAGGFLAGAGAAAGLGSTAVGTFAGGLASGTTWGATVAAALGGIGSGTETGLNSGMDYNSAFKLGLKEGAKQGAMAFAGGKLGEKLAKNAAIKDATKLADKTDDALNAAKLASQNADDAAKAAAKAFDKADDALGVAQKSLDQADDALKAASDKLDDLWTRGASDKAIAAQEKIVNQADDAFKAASQSYDDALNAAKNARTLMNETDDALGAANKALNQADDAANAAKEGLKTAQNSKLSDFQGYSDSITKAGQRAGETTVKTVQSGGKYLANTAKAATSGLRGANPLEQANLRQAASESWDDFVTNGKQLITQDNIVAQGLHGAGKTIGNAWTGAKATATSIRENGLVTTVGNGLKNTASSAGNALKSITPAHIVETVSHASPVLPGALAATANAVGSEKIQAQAPGYGGKGPMLNGANQVGGGLGETISSQLVYGPPQPVVDPAVNPQVQATPEQVVQPTGSSGNPSGGGNNGGGGGGYTPQLPTTPYTTPPTLAPVTMAPTQPRVTDAPTSPQTNTPTTYAPVTQPPYASPYKEPPTTPGQHSGGGYGSDGYTGDGTGTNLAASIADVLDDSEKSIDEIIKGSKYSRIPTSSKPILSSKSSGTSSVIPIAAGLSVASAAGLGAKAYLDHKRAQSEEDEEDEEYDEDYEADDDFVVDGWTEGDDTLAIEPEEDSTEFINQDKVDDDEYYHAAESPFPIMSQEELEEF